MGGSNWVCPYCGHAATITDAGKDSTWAKIDFAPKAEGFLYLEFGAIRCPNDECLEVMLHLTVDHCVDAGGNARKRVRNLKRTMIFPDSTAKPQPPYIPQPIRDDYGEACRIRDLSPKASATLSRRCLQGVIRDFWEIQKARLKDEIDALKEIVDDELWGAIDGVRKVGNIGAHMERDINTIVDVDPDEAQILIGLLELLFKETYVARENRRRRLDDMKKLALEKAPETKRPTPKSG